MLGVFNRTVTHVLLLARTYMDLDSVTFWRESYGDFSVFYERER